jgi:integrase
MGRKRTPGLVLRGECWHIDKWIKGHGRLCESAKTGSLEEAEAYLARRTEEIRQASVYGVRPKRFFADAAAEYLRRHEHKRSLERDARDLTWLVKLVGEVSLERVHDGSFDPLRRDAKVRGISPGTVNRALSVARRVLYLAAVSWRDEHGLSWLQTAPLIERLPDDQKRKPYPLDWGEQRLLFSELPGHLAEMALCAVNTGCREQEVVRLRWDWEIKVPELSTSVFLIPADFGGRTSDSGVKNKLDRLVVLNSVANSIIEAQRGRHPERVFTYPGRFGTSAREPVTKMYNTAWRSARERAASRYEQELGTPCPEGFRHLRVHDLKHTFGRRLRAAGVSFEDRQDLLGHKSQRVTTEYSAGELTHLIDAANKATRQESRKSPAITLLRTRARVSA